MHPVQLQGVFWILVDMLAAHRARAGGPEPVPESESGSETESETESGSETADAPSEFLETMIAVVCDAIRGKDIGPSEKMRRTNARYADLVPLTRKSVDADNVDSPVWRIIGEMLPEMISTHARKEIGDQVDDELASLRMGEPRATIDGNRSGFNLRYLDILEEFDIDVDLILVEKFTELMEQPNGPTPPDDIVRLLAGNFACAGRDGASVRKNALLTPERLQTAARRAHHTCMADRERRHNLN